MTAQIRARYSQIIIYYSFRKQILRLPTLVKIDKTKATQFNELFKQGKYPPEIIDSYSLVRELLDRVNDAISHSLATRQRKPYPTEIQDYLGINHKATDNSLVSYVLEYEETKRKQYSEGLFSMTSLKDYVSFRNTVIDYQTQLGRKLLIEDVNLDFIGKYYHFLTTPRINSKTKKFKSKGNLKGKTTKKRLDILKAFYNWLSLDKGLVRDSDKFAYKINKEFNVNKGNITTIVKNFALDKFDIEQLKTLIENPKLTNNQRLAAKLFLFICYSGVRYAELGEIKREHIKRYKGRYILEKKSKKTSRVFQVPLNQFSIDLLREHNFNLGIYSNTNLNTHLKKALLLDDYFSDIIEDYQLPKNQLITCHTGRRTFITRLLNEFKLPPSQVMRMSGHTQIATLSKYIYPSPDLFNTDLF
tara:strand:+ start:4116 stop:5363 length:1248 start_codon:yes stop_codon:yes gene_type:complete